MIFTDELIVQLECHQRKCFHKKKMPRRLKYRHKHPPKVNVWCGISKQGATQLVMFSGIMNATKYGDIPSASLVPFIAERFPPTHRLYQDNDLKHTSRYIQRFFADNRMNWWKSPAVNPDLNLIELVWGLIKMYL